MFVNESSWLSNCGVLSEEVARDAPVHVWLFHFKNTDALRRSERRSEAKREAWGSLGWGVPLAGDVALTPPAGRATPAALNSVDTSEASSRT